MTYVITQNCCNDATCVAVCPVDCIHPTPDEANYARTEMLYIDAASCIDCGACSDVCPVDAIVPDDTLSATQASYLDINAEYFVANPRTASAGAHVQPPLRKTACGAPDETLRVAIVGSGPAAFYAAEELLTRNGVQASVTMIERLPVAGGLVRFGVAPDHGLTKTVDRTFDRTARREGFSMFLDVELGRDFTLAELSEHHHAVLHASGASGDRAMGIPGEELPGSHSAREFVSWYNGHPDHIGAVFDLTTSRVVVVGNGNVALDVARILLSDGETLGKTDMADHALAALADSAVEEVMVLGRRGPQFAACTVPELLALGSLPGIDVHVEGAVDVSEASPIKQRILHEYSSRRTVPGNKRIVLRFDTSPVELIGRNRVEGLRVVDTADGRISTIETGLVFRSIGYRGRPIDDLPFDDESGTVSNLGGRVMDPSGLGPMPGQYVAGWIKRGPTGVIGTNRYCAAETVETVIEDFVEGRLLTPDSNPDEFEVFVRQRRPGALDVHAWREIDRHERRAGVTAGRPRVKMVDAELVRRFVRDQREA
ncbi:ferredoxin [Rhodococcus sp. 14-2686-1-2]|nr:MULTISPECIES: FAD-dependent oxidoreductase [unclassified Rhodococcus (in: high G+C Gram-positive bacteria)]OZE93158.1 ferredoxin [Rhodococcus sp. 15-1189-1-1a]OZF08276.1 ferredoxin [Rhodococcus sp. 14-2686-1-2]